MSRAGVALVTALLGFSVRRPRRVVIVAALLTLGSLAALPSVRLKLDGRSLIPAGHPGLAASDQAARLFHLRDVVVVGLARDGAGGIYDPGALSLVRGLSSDLAAVPGVRPGSVASLTTLPRLAIADETIDLTPLLAPPRPPTPERIAQLRRETAALGLDDGVLVTRDGRTTAIYAEVEVGADRYAVLGEVRRLLAARPAGEVEVFLSGTALAQAVLGLAAAGDLLRLVPLVIGVLALVLFLAFRHPVPALVSLAEIGASLLATAGLMGLCRESVFVTTLVLPVILIAIGVSDDVYALNNFFRLSRAAPEAPTERVVLESFGAVARPILLTGLTTIVGLLSLLVTPLEPQRIFGLYGAFAILASTVSTFTLVPALLCLLRPRPRPLTRKVEAESGAPLWCRRFLGRLGRLGPRRVLASLAVVATAALLVAGRLRVEDNWVRNLPPGGDIAAGDRALNQRMAGTTRVELLVGSRHPQGFLDPQELAALGRLGDTLARDPHTGAVASVFDDVVRAEAALAGADYHALRAELAAGRASLSPVAVERALLMLATLRGSPLGERIEETHRRARVTVFVNQASYARIGRLLATARAAAEGGSGPRFDITPFGDGWISFLAVELLVSGQVRSVGVALLANALLLWLLFRSLPTTLLALTPIVTSVLLVFAALAATGTPLGIANSMFAAVALGIGVDYSIHLVARYRDRLGAGLGRGAAIHAAFESTAPAILKSSLAICSGLAVLAFSEVLPNLQLALLVCLSLTVSAAMTLLIVPAMVLAAERRGGSEAEPTELSKAVRAAG